MEGHVTEKNMNIFHLENAIFHFPNAVFHLEKGILKSEYPLNLAALKLFLPIRIADVFYRVLWII